MITPNQPICAWLANKYLLFSIGIYATLTGIMLFTWLGTFIGLPLWASTFAAFFVTVFARTFYEQLIILDVPRVACSWSKNVIFALTYAVIMSFVFHFIKSSLGYWSIPIILVVAQTVIKPVKAILWPSKPAQGLRAVYVQKQNIYMASLYGFYGLLAAIAVIEVQVLNISFVFAFGAAVLMALVASMLFEFHYLYEQQFHTKTTIKILLLALALAVMATASVVLLVTHGFSGKAATILCCVTAKIIEQYVLARWMCSPITCAMCNRQ